MQQIFGRHFVHYRKPILNVYKHYMIENVEDQLLHYGDSPSTKADLKINHFMASEFFSIECNTLDYRQVQY